MLNTILPTMPTLMALLLASLALLGLGVALYVTNELRKALNWLTQPESREPPLLDHDDLRLATEELLSR